jgi:hypothetical protein
VSNRSFTAFLHAVPLELAGLSLVVLRPLEEERIMTGLLFLSTLFPLARRKFTPSISPV